jgi:hypothetical protein
MASFSGLTLSGTAGSYTLRFTGASLTADAAAATALAAGAPAGMAFQAAPSTTAQVGLALAQQPRLRVTDASGNPVAGLSVSAAVVEAGASVSGASGTTATTDASGDASFGGLALAGATGSYTLRFSAASLTLDATVTLNPGPVTSLTIVTQPPAAAQNGVALAPVPVVEARDAANNPVSGVTVTVGAGTVGLTPGAAVTDAGGQATFTGLTLFGTVGSYTLTFAVGSVTATASAATALAAGSAAKLFLTTPPPTAARSGVALSTQPVVQVTDAGGNATPTSGRIITATLVSGSLTIANATATTDAGGVAAFSGLTLSGATGSYRLRFSEPNLAAVTAPQATIVTAGPATQIALTTQPSNSAILGTPLRRQPVVQVQDAQGNPLDTTGVSVVASVVSGTPTLSGTTAQTSSGGAAVFSGLAIAAPQGGFRFRFTASGLPVVTAAESTTVVPALTSGSPLTGIASSVLFQQKPFAITVPAGADSLVVDLAGPTGSLALDDADIVVRYGAVPNINGQLWDCFPRQGGNFERCVFPNPQAGDWYVIVYTFSAYSGVTLTTTVWP